MPDGFFKFPRTPHLTWLSANSARDDRVLSSVEAQQFLKSEIIVEEKIDGANVGISVVDGLLRAQNRGAYIERPSPPQFGPLWTWLAQRQSLLTNALGANLMLFGEWCFAVHSIRYDRLPDWFLAFDVYDRMADRFWSVARRNSLMKGLGIKSVPKIAEGRFTAEELSLLLSRGHSSLGAASIEGLYLRSDVGMWLVRRAKLVRPGFIQDISDHWSTRRLEKNLVAN